LSRSVDSAGLHACDNQEESRAGVRRLTAPLFFYGALLATLGLAVHFLGILFSSVRLLLFLEEAFWKSNDAVIWFSGLPCTLAIIVAFADIAVLLPRNRRFSRAGSLAPTSDRRVLVALTAYNDAKSIAGAVTDFRESPLVREVQRTAIALGLSLRKMRRVTDRLRTA